MGRDLFNYLATNTHHGDKPIDIFKISRKQYYTMLQKLKSADLIKRRKSLVSADAFRDGDLRSTTGIWQGPT